MKHSITFHPSLLLAVGERLSRAPRSNTEFPIGIGDFEDPEGKIAAARARQLFWHAFGDEAQDAVRLLYDDWSLFLVSESTDAEALMNLHLNPWFERFGFRDPDGDIRRPDSFSGLRSDVVAAVCAVGTDDGESPELLPQLVDGKSMIIPANPADVLHAYSNYSLSGGPVGMPGPPGHVVDCFLDLNDELDISLRYVDLDPESDGDGGPMMGWNPVFETRVEAKSRLMSLFERLLDRALDEREQEACDRGLVK